MGELLGAVDIGGTKLHAIIATPEGSVLARARRKAKAKKGFAKVIERVVACLEKACDKAGVRIADLSAIGVGAPSPIRPDGTAVNAPNMGWRDAPLVAALSDALGKPVVAENDCNLGTLGEYSYGAGRGAKSLVGLFMGTGLGGGIVLDGKMVRGTGHLAAEIGHMIVRADGRQCGCGHRGCLEAYASKTGIGKRLEKEIDERGRQSSLLEEKGIDLANVRGGSLARAFRAGDEVVREALLESARYLGIGVANLVTLFGPDVVVLGGGVLEALGSELLPPVVDAARAFTFPEAAFPQVDIVLSQLGDDAVALGAVAYARSALSPAFAAPPS
jgi:glucokinase